METIILLNFDFWRTTKSYPQEVSYRVNITPSGEFPVNGIWVRYQKKKKTGIMAHTKKGKLTYPNYVSLKSEDDYNF